MKSEWHERLAAFKKYYGYTNADLARMSGNALGSVKNISQGEVPGWLKFAIQVWEKAGTMPLFKVGDKVFCKRRKEWGRLKITVVKDGTLFRVIGDKTATEGCFPHGYYWLGDDDLVAEADII